MATTTTMEPIAVYGDPVDDDEGCASGAGRYR